MASIKQYIPFMGEDENDGYDSSVVVKIGTTTVEDEEYDVLLDKASNPPEYHIIPKNYDETVDEIYTVSSEDILTQDSLGLFVWESDGLKFSFLTSTLRGDSIFTESKRNIQRAYAFVILMLFVVLAVFSSIWLGNMSALGLIILCLGGSVYYYYKSWQKENSAKLAGEFQIYSDFLTSYMNRFFKYSYIAMGIGGAVLILGIVLKILGR